MVVDSEEWEDGKTWWVSKRATQQSSFVGWLAGKEAVRRTAGLVPWLANDAWTLWLAVMIWLL